MRASARRRRWRQTATAMLAHLGRRRPNARESAKTQSLANVPVQAHARGRYPLLPALHARVPRHMLSMLKCGLRHTTLNLMVLANPMVYGGQASEATLCQIDGPIDSTRAHPAPDAASLPLLRIAWHANKTSAQRAQTAMCAARSLHNACTPGKDLIA